MPRPRRADVKPPGRPVKPINWDLVDDLMAAGLSGPQIAPHFDMHVETFYQRCQIEKGVGFTGYSLEKNYKGEGLLKYKQYKEALKGNTQLLMFLGKVRLQQREVAEVALSEETTKTFSMVLSQLQQAREGRKADTNLSQQKPDTNMVQEDSPSK